MDTNNLDVLLGGTLARPKQMLPGWPSQARWPFVGIPESLLSVPAGEATGTEPMAVSGMPIVNPEP